MPKKRITITQHVIAKITKGEITMKPRWYFVAGSLFMMAGLASFTVMAVFLLNLTFFLLRRHGPMGSWRLELILNSFSWWIPVVAIVGMVLGIVIFKTYDFSYKKNFPLIVIGFILSVMLAAFAMDYLGLNDAWSRRGPMRGFYQHIEGVGPRYFRQTR